MNHWIIAPLLLPMAAAVANLFLGSRGPRPQATVSLCATAGLLPIAIGLLLRAWTGVLTVYQLGNWPAPFGIVLVLDRLSALLLLVTALTALGSLVYAMAGDDRRGHHFHVFFPLQLLGLNGAFLTGDLFTLFVFFEVLLIASFALALHGGGPERTRAGLRYVVLNLIGSALFLIALGLLYGALGTLNMADLWVKATAAGPEQETLVRVAALLLLVVFAFKAALPPVHLWLPSLYSGAVAPVAALFAIMTKVGIYALLRVQTLVFPAGAGAVAGRLLPWLALLALVAGAVGVLGSRRLRRLIAWLVVVSAGTLMAGIGQGSAAGIGAALFYLPHTTLVTAGLFLLAGLIAEQRGQADDRLAPGPALSRPTLLGLLFLFGAVASAGLPPLSGFLGKLLLLRSAQPGFAVWLWPTLLSVSLVGLAALSRAGSELFWHAEGVDLPRRALPMARVVPVVLLLSASLLLSVFAGPVSRYAEAAAVQLLSPAAYRAAVLAPEPRP